MPKLNEVVGVIVEEAEGVSLLGHTIIPENVVNSEPASNVERATEEGGRGGGIKCSRQKAVGRSPNTFIC